MPRGTIRRILPRMTVRMRLLLVLAAMSVMAVVAMTVPFVATNVLLDDFQRAADGSLRVATAYADLNRALGAQESGVSGYVLTEDPDFADQYFAGVAAERQAYDLLATAAARRPHSTRASTRSARPPRNGAQAMRSPPSTTSGSAGSRPLAP